MPTTTFVTLKEGSNGDAVAKLQQRLKTLGFDFGEIDGVFGPKTKATVIKFQRINSLVPDGIVGFETESALERNIWVLNRPTLQEGATGEDVKELQSLLERAQYLEQQLGGSLKLDVGAVDGVFGVKTKAATIEFQNHQNISADGVVGPITWNRLSFILTFDLTPEVIVLNNVFDLA